MAHGHLASGGNFHGDAGKWLRGTARNRVRAWWREKRKLPLDLADRLAFLAEPDDARSQEMAAALAHCLGKLESDDRQVISKRYELGLAVGAIAEQMQCNVATLRVRLFRIRRGLKACVETQLSRGGPS